MWDGPFQVPWKKCLFLTLRSYLEILIDAPTLTTQDPTDVYSGVKLTARSQVSFLVHRELGFARLERESRPPLYILLALRIRSLPPFFPSSSQPASPTRIRTGLGPSSRPDLTQSKHLITVRVSADHRSAIMSIPLLQLANYGHMRTSGREHSTRCATRRGVLNRLDTLVSPRSSRLILSLDLALQLAHLPLFPRHRAFYESVRRGRGQS
jgi:hypothetical protein